MQASIPLAEIQDYLYTNIPLSRAMQVQVMSAGWAGVTLTAPLAPNINHRETVFGGSASAVAILSAWTLLYLRLRQLALPSRIVIQHNVMHYLRPMPEAFSASASLADDAAWDRFIRMFNRRHRARITVGATLHCRDEVVGSLEGEFVAFATDAA